MLLKSSSLRVVFLTIYFLKKLKQFNLSQADAAVLLFPPLRPSDMEKKMCFTYFEKAITKQVRILFSFCN